MWRRLTGPVVGAQDSGPLMHRGRLVVVGNLFCAVFRMYPGTIPSIALSYVGASLVFELAIRGARAEVTLARAEDSDGVGAWAWRNEAVFAFAVLRGLALGWLTHARSVSSTIFTDERHRHRPLG